jgi:hypothetical protein
LIQKGDVLMKWGTMIKPDWTNRWGVSRCEVLAVERGVVTLRVPPTELGWWDTTKKHQMMLEEGGSWRWFTWEEAAVHKVLCEPNKDIMPSVGRRMQVLGGSFSHQGLFPSKYVS